ncbi:MAG: alpha/beta hydrolase-fold protein [Longimicrobiales bacterium]
MRYYSEKASVVLALAGLSGLGLIGASQIAAQQEPVTKFRISFPAAAHSEPVTGRIFVMLSDNTEREPRFQIGRTGVPFYGRDVEGLRPGQAGTIDQTDLGSPINDLRDLPAGDYYVQAMVNIYSEFRRSDGHTLWMHDDQWEGQQLTRSPGNLYSDVQRVHLDPRRGFDVELVASHKIPPVEVPPDDQWVKRFKIQSDILTKFWGRPVYLGATVLLPKDYDRETMDYPVLYSQGHFSLRNPLGFAVGTQLYQDWMKDNFPRMVVVTFQHPAPYFDDSYAVNSANVGPYGDAIMQELIPEVERRFRIIKEPWARLLDGGSTGGWESLALQLFYPDFYGGVWSYCPDPVTFTNVEGANIYEDENFFWKQKNEWFRVPTVNTRETNGDIRLTSQQRNYFELALGTKGRSGEQLDIWSAVHGPVGEDGYFKPLFDKRTGVIDQAVALYWRDHYDLLEYMKRNWTSLGPKIYSKLYIYSGDMDNVRLDQPVREMQAWMKTTQNPHYEGFFVYGDRKPHCFRGPVDMSVRLQEMAQHILRFKPDWATSPWWNY